MRARTTVALLGVLLLAAGALGVGVTRATAQLGSSPRAHAVVDRLTPAPAPATRTTPTSTATRARTRTAKPTPAGARTTQPTPLSDSTPAPRAKPSPTAPALRPGKRLLGPGDTGAQVRELQARLRQIGWFSGDVTDTYGSVTTTSVRGFQAKRGIPVTGYVDRRTRDRLEAMTHEPTTAELTNRLTPMGNTPGRLDPRCLTGRALCIDKTSRTLRFVVDGTVRRTVDVRFGASYSPTREGVFHVYLKDADHVSHLYGSAMPYSMFFSRGQAVHYSSDFAARGYAGASHGCVNVRDLTGIRWLFAHVRVGDPVVVYWS
ncbi:MAG: L,D-transpeptidase family protein [Marmoricola sp.]